GGPDWRLVTDGGGGLTCTVLVAVLPFSATATWVVPAPTAVTGTGTLVWPLAKEIEAGTVATPGFALVTVIVPAADGVGESVAVKVPELPCVIVSVLGCRLVTNGGGGLTCTVLLAVLPFSKTVIWVESTPTAVTGTG